MPARALILPACLLASFAQAQSFPSPYLPDTRVHSSRVVGDFDGDGNLDLLSVLHTQEDEWFTVVRFQSAPSRFDDPIVSRLPNVSLSYGELVVVDFDGDGDSEFVLPIAGIDRVPIMRLAASGEVSQVGELPQIGDFFGPYAIADYNLDGVSDIATYVTVDDERFLEVYFGTVGNSGAPIGDGLVLDGPHRVPEPVGNRPTAEDLDGDGDTDIRFFEFGAESVWARNDGAGAFEIVSPDAAHFVGIEDLDGDGQVEFITLNNEETLTLNHDWYGENPTVVGSITIEHLGPLDNYILSGVQFADVDGDGLPDLIARCQIFSSNYEIRVYLNAGGFVFDPPRRYISPNGFSDPPDIGDLDGDGRADIFTRTSHAMQIALTTEDGALSLPEVLDLHMFSRNLTVADLNGDTLPDLVTDQSQWDYAIATGGGRYADDVLSNTMNCSDFPEDPNFAQALFLSAGDYNGDGNVDLFKVCGNRGVGPYTTQVYLWDGAGRFKAMPQSSSLIPGRTFGVAKSLDYDGDGDTDVLYHNRLDKRVDVYENVDGMGRLIPRLDRPLELGVIRSFDTADYDGDGRIDLAILSESQEVMIAYQINDGFFERPVSVATASSGFPITAGDVDGDGDDDLLVYQSRPAVLLNDGAGNFTERTIDSRSGRRVAQSIELRPTIADLDADGLPDILTMRESVFGSTEYELVILRGTGLGEFEDAGFRLRTHFLNTSVADFDGDGDQDIMLYGQDDSAFDPRIMLIRQEGSPRAGTFGADCNGDGGLNWNDVLCALVKFGTQDPDADCDASGDVDFADLLCILLAIGD